MRCGLAVVTPVKTSNTAVLVRADGKETWVPFAFMMNSDDYDWLSITGSGDTVTIEMPRWWLDKNQMDYDSI